MKRRFTILTAALALLVGLMIPLGMWGQTRESYNVTYSYDDLGDMLYGSYLDASSYWKVPETSGNNAVISIPITYQPTSNITVTFHIATFGSGTNPSSSNTTITAVGTETGSNWSGSGISSYPSSSTYVDGVMTITKPDNPTTLGGLDITMGVNTGVKIFRLQSVTISYTYGGGQTTYTVTFNAGDGTFVGNNDFPNTTNTKEAGEYTLPSATPADGYTFDGWALGEDTFAGGASYTVNGDADFVASYTENTTPGGEEHWVLTSLADLTANDVFVIVGNGYAMTNNNGTGTAPATSAVTIANNEITSTVAANIKWTVSGNATDGYTFYPNGSTTTWLYCSTTANSSSNNNIRVGTGNRKVFELNSSNFLMTKDNYVVRYLSIYENQDWRGYINTNLCPAMSFYKKVTGGVLPPSITADNVNIAYNATTGSIAYTINNEPSPAGTLTAAVTDGNWLTLGQGTTSPISFTCTANENTTARTATVTLTYTYDTDQTVTANVTVTQAAAPVIYSTIPALFAAATSTETNVLVTFNDWVVSGVSTNGKNVFVTDNNGNGFVIFDNNGGLENTYTAGDALSGTAVSCSLKKYNGFAELLNVDANDLTITTGGAVTVANVAMADLAGVNTGALLHYEGLTCEIDGNKTNLSDGNTTIQVYNALYAFEALEDGKTYNITGIYQQYNSTKEILPRSAADIEEVVSTVPSITVDPDEVNVDAEEHDGTLDLTYQNLEIESFEDFDIQFYDAEGNELDENNEPDWIEVTTAEDEDVLLVSYFILENDGEARSAYFKVFAMGDEDFVYSNLVTVNQAAPVAPVTGDEYVLYTGELVEGDYVICYNNTTWTAAMKNTVESGRLSYEEVTPDNGVVITDDATIVWHIAQSGDYWTIYSADANAYAAGTGVKNKAQMLDNGTDDLAMWTVTGTDAYDFVNKGNAAANVNAYLRNNTTYGFACYAATTGGALSLYKKVEATETYTLDITGYTANSTGGYYLFASPVTVDPATVEGMTEGTFDLYYFDQAEEDEWRNYEAQPFSLVPGKGYLYAKQATTEGEIFHFTLTGTPYSGNGMIELDYTEGGDFPGWNLVGNPYGVAAEISNDFYVMNGDGTEIIAGESEFVEPMQGVFVIAENDDDYVIFEPAVATGPGYDKIVMNVCRERGNVIDRAIVRFGEGRQLPKFQLNANSTKLYIAEGENEYAVVRSANEGEMPVSFKAAENGTYTLSVNAENMEMNYLHLIDNMTKADVDLLANPNYTFEANTTDLATRFTLVFAATGMNENTTQSFAFFNGSEWVISNMGEATLQVVDVMGRIVSSETINGNTSVSLNQTSGVYMLRLVNGDNVKVQKVVVR